tara:strand:+ start:2196 stop:2582 length:387 start_codon:yes stop_codon:yes gene_type:complete
MSKFSSRSGRTGSRGYRASVEEDKVVTSEAGSGTQPLFTEDMIGESTASVGLSVSMGFSTQFAREKFEVSTWVTRPCKDSEADRAAVFAECKKEAIEKAIEVRNEIVDQLLPHMEYVKDLQDDWEAPE